MIKKRKNKNLAKKGNLYKEKHKNKGRNGGMEGLLETKAGPSLAANLYDCYWEERSAWVSQTSDFFALVLLRVELQHQQERR